MLLIPSGVKPVIGDVVAKSPALKAGFKPGDILLAIDNVPLYNEQEVIQIISKHKNIPISATVLRVKDTLNLNVTPSSVGIIGVHLGQVFTGETEFESIGFLDSFNYGVKNIIRILPN